MDFLDPAKKRAHTTRLFIGYILVAIAVALATLVLSIASFGYGINKKGQIIQNGLLFVSSHPDQADAHISSSDGATNQTAKTNTRLVLPESRYTVSLSKTGYRPWQKTITLEGGSVERLIYPLLFPEKLITKDTQLYASKPSFATQSPDRHWIIVQHPGSMADFDLFDTTQPTQAPTLLTIPAGVLSQDTGKQYWELIAWASDNRHVLLKHVFDGHKEFIMLDRQTPQSITNLNTSLAIEPSQVGLRNKKADQLYVYTAKNETLQTASTKTKKLSLVVKHVLDFHAYGDNKVVYVSDENIAKTGKVTVKIYDAGHNYTLRQLPANSKYLLDLAEYNNQLEVVAGALSENQVYIYKDPLNVLTQTNPKSTIIARTLRLVAPASVSFSPDAHYVAVQSAQKFVAYDSEKDRQYRFTLDQTLDNPAQPALWMDGSRLVSSTQGKALAFEFDGANSQVLNATVSGQQVFFSPDYTGLFTIAPSVNVPKRSALTFTDLVVK